MEREKTVRFFRESMSNRLNDDNSAIVIIMQRLHDGDVSGDILAREADYCHLMIPMRFEPMVYPASVDGERTEDPETGEPFEGNEIGWIDPRAYNENGEVMSPREMAKYAGELAWPERFDEAYDRAMSHWCACAVTVSRVPSRLCGRPSAVGLTLFLFRSRMPA
jgi:hypothetical protein